MSAPQASQGGIRGMFKGLGGATATLNFKYFHAGQFITRINKILARNTRTSGTGFILEQKCIAVIDNGGVTDTVKLLRPGLGVSHVITNGGERADMFLGNVKAVLAQLAQAKDPTFLPESLTDEQWDELFDRAISDEQILSHQYVQVVGTPIVTKKGKDFTRISYERGYNPLELRRVLQAINQNEELTHPNGALQAEIDAMVQAQAAE